MTLASPIQATYRPRHTLSCMDEAIEWLRKHWDDQRPGPIRLHDARQTEGELGGLPYSGAFAATLAWSPNEVRKMTTTVICRHRFAKGRTDECPECGGDGVYDATADRFTYPMTLALSRLAHIVPTRYHPHPIRVVYVLASEAGWSARLASRILGLHWDLGEALILRSLRQLHDRFEAGPVATPGWTSLSESQQRAIEAGEVDAIA